MVKGGRRFSFGALVVVGDHNGRVGYGLGKAKEVPEAIRKAIEAAKKALVDGAARRRARSPSTCTGHYGAGHVLLRPAGEGTGVIAGGGVRAVVELAGVRNVLTKCLGSHNPHNMVKATIAALQQLQTPEQVAARRGKAVAELTRVRTRRWRRDDDSRSRSVGSPIGQTAAAAADAARPRPDAASARRVVVRDDAPTRGHDREGRSTWCAWRRKTMDLSDLRPAPGRASRASGSDADRARASARRRAAVTRARGARSGGNTHAAASRAARCRCSAACRSAASTTRSAREYAIVNLGAPRGGVRRRRRGRCRPRWSTHGLVRSGRPVKVLGQGELTKALTVKAHAFSESAKSASPPPAAASR